MYLLGQFFGIGAMICFFILYQQKSRKGIILTKLTADFFWISHYLCLGGVTGMISNSVAVFREIVFYNRKKSKWLDNIFWPILVIGIIWTLAISKIETMFDVLPPCASTFATIALWLNNPKLTKIISAPASASFLIYNIYLKSVIGIASEVISLTSIIIFFTKEAIKKRKNKVFTPNIETSKELMITEGAPIADVAKRITYNTDETALKKGKAFAKEITERFVADFERKEDKMCHVSTFIVVDGTLYVSYYANTKEPSEDPKNQTARLAYAPIDNTENITILDLQTTGDTVGGKVIDMVYDTILMQKDKDTIYVMWTARTEENYYRFYCPFTLSTKTLGKVKVNRIKVGNVTNDFSVSGIKSAFAENEISIKNMYSDIGIMQKLSSREENGKLYYYTGTYSGDFTAIIKSEDLITWEYVSQPDFINDSKWENATYVLGDKVYYFVRQQDENPYGFLTTYNLEDGTWEKPVEIEDCQSRSDFIVYGDELYLFHAPIDREHIGIVKIDTKNLADSKVVLQAKMESSCFYPFVQYYKDNELAMSYTVSREHIRLAEFNLNKYL